jgi:oligopeptidase A
MAPSADSNPLLDIRFRIPFDQIRAEHVEPAIHELLRDGQAKREALSAPVETRTFENTMAALDALTTRLDYAMGVVKHLEGVATYPALRAAYNAVQPAASEFYSRIPLDEGLWKAIRE